MVIIPEDGMISETAREQVALLLRVTELKMNNPECKPCFLSVMPLLHGTVLCCSVLDKYDKMDFFYRLQSCWECFV